MQYDVVFEGGGAKGFAFVGAMQEFEAVGHSFGRVVGSSAGAITATSLAAGYSSAEMLDSLSEMAGNQPVFATFLGDPPAPAQVEDSALAEFFKAVDFSFVPDWAEGRIEGKLLDAIAGSPIGRQLLSFFDYGGFYSADAFVEWFERKLSDGATRDGRPRRFGKMTFAELFRQTGVDLSLTASDTTNNVLRILNHRTTPDLPVVWGARMSMSVPLLWQEVVWRDEWGPYRVIFDGKTVEIPLAGSVMVDGGLLSNFPIELLVSKESGVRQIMGQDVSPAVVGFLIDERLPVPDAPPPPPGKMPAALGKLGSLRTTQRLRALVDTVTQARDKMVIDENKSRVVRLPAKNYDIVDFNMPVPRREALITAAAGVTRDYFAAQESGGLESFGDEPSTAESDRIARSLLGLD